MSEEYACEPTDPEERRLLRQAVFDRLATNAMERGFEKADPGLRVVMRAIELYEMGLTKEYALERARVDVGLLDHRGSPLGSAAEDPSAQEDDN